MDDESPFDLLEASVRESMLAHIMAADASLRFREVALAYARRMTSHDLQLLRVEMREVQRQKPGGSAYDQATGQGRAPAVRDVRTERPAPPGSRP
jgi:hypothetical protein